jgi:hypothetical protein
VDDGAGDGIDLAGAGHADGKQRGRGGCELPDQLLERRDDGVGAAAGVRRPFDVREEVAVDADGTDPDVRTADVDPDDVSYAFFSSSFFAAAVVGSSLTSFTPFLNSLTLDPSERASSGRRFAPNRISTMTSIISSS